MVVKKLGRIAKKTKYQSSGYKTSITTLEIAIIKNVQFAPLRHLLCQLLIFFCFGGFLLQRYYFLPFHKVRVRIFYCVTFKF